MNLIFGNHSADKSINQAQFLSWSMWIGLTLALAFGAGCIERDEGYYDTTIHELNSGWEFREGTSENWFPAEVPGDAMTDLMRVGVIPDPFYGTVEKDVQWVEKTDWIYRCIFPLSENADDLHPSAQELVFEGIDTFSEIRINGQLHLETDNMHRIHVVPIPRETASPCTLEITLKSPVITGEKIIASLPRLIPTSNEDKPIGKRTSSVIRKAKYQFGWDWGPRLTSSGIWRPVSLRESDDLKEEEIQLSLLRLEQNQATYLVKGPLGIETGQISIQGPENGAVNYSTSDWEMRQCTLKIQNPERWWPRGMGDQPLYTLQWSSLNQSLPVRFGIREIEWDRSEDEWGTAFHCSINGQPFFAKGANVIPPDFFPARAEKMENQLIQNALEARMNMLRVWGGGVYPSDSFLDRCDEEGILLWQDFMFACGMVRGDQAHLANIQLEATDQIKRMRNHPCLALMCGNNESRHAWENWGWPEAFALQGTDSMATERAYEAVFDKLLPNTIDSLSDLVYWPSSPMPDPSAPPLALSGDAHAWRVWFDTLDFDYFSNHKGRFASEYGLQSLPALKTLQEAGIQDWESEALQFRQRSKMEWLQEGLDGWGMMQIYARRYTADPMQIDSAMETGKRNALERWIYLSQLTQAIGLREAIERHRNSKGKIAGSLYWQLDDVWPAVSWSTVDHAGRWKLAHHAVRHANADQRIIWTRNPLDKGQAQVHNQSPLKLVNSQLTVQWRDKSGAVQNSATQAITIDAFATLDHTFEPPNTDCALVTWDWRKQGGESIDSGHQLFVRPSEIQWPKAKIHVDQNEDEFTVYSDRIAYGVRLTADGDGRFSDNGFLLLPGIENARNLTFISAKEGASLPSLISLEDFGSFQ